MERRVSIVVGGQYGSEGKGKASGLLMQKLHASIFVRVGGPNSGHTIYKGNQKYALRMLPSCSVFEGTKCVLAAGSFIDVAVLLREVDELGLGPDDLMVDPLASIITQECLDEERRSGLGQTISSTLSGTGAALVARIRGTMSDSPVLLARDVPELGEFICDTTQFLRKRINGGERVVIEGTQGFGLSVYSDTYPYCTSRDVTASGFLSEVGLSPFDVEHVVMVLRAFPIRVGGESGPLKNEISWEQLTEMSGSVHPLVERTTVTNKIRRIAQFDPDLVKRAIMVNKPDMIFLNHVDYIDMCNSGNDVLTERQLDFVREVEQSIQQRIDCVGNGPQTDIWMDQI